MEWPAALATFAALFVVVYVGGILIGIGLGWLEASIGKR